MSTAPRSVRRGVLEWEEAPQSGALCCLKPARWRRVHAECGGGELKLWPDLELALVPTHQTQDTEPLCSVNLLEPAPAKTAALRVAHRPPRYAFQVEAHGAKKLVLAALSAADMAGWLDAVAANGALAGAQADHQEAQIQADAIAMGPQPEPEPEPAKTADEIEALALRRHPSYVDVGDIPTWSQVGYEIIESLQGLEDVGYMPRERLNASIKLWRGDICRLNAGAVVNAANWKLVAGGGICGAIFAAAGLRELTAQCETLHPQGCKEGQTVVTSGCRLKSPYIFHTVGPQGPRPDVLRSCYTTCLDKASELGLGSIAFCMISTGIFGYPRRDATREALAAIRVWLECYDKSPPPPQIVLVVYKAEDETLYKTLLPTFFPMP